MRVSPGLLVTIQLWLLMPSSSKVPSLRGATGIDAVDEGEYSVSVDASAGDDGETDKATEAEDLEKPRMKIRKRGIQNISFAANNSSDIATIDRFHRDQRGKGGMIFQTRIIGGRASLGNEHSFTVSLHDLYGNHFCGGSLVSKDAVLTAAHCSNKVTGKGPITVVVGRHTLSDESEGEELRVRTERLHPRYDVTRADSEWKYDFALLFLKRPTMTRAKIIALNRDERRPRRGSLVSVHGWGDTNPIEHLRVPSDTLQVANLRTVSNEQCDAMTGQVGQYTISYHGFIHEDMMCAKNRKRDSCQGDSGGPLTYRDKQVGLTSWGVGCNNRIFPGVYARISSAYDWIRSNICSRSMLPNDQFECEPW